MKKKLYIAFFALLFILMQAQLFHQMGGFGYSFWHALIASVGATIIFTLPMIVFYFFTDNKYFGLIFYILFVIFVSLSFMDITNADIIDAVIYIDINYVLLPYVIYFLLQKNEVTNKAIVAVDNNQKPKSFRSKKKKKKLFYKQAVILSKLEKIYFNNYVYQINLPGVKKPVLATSTVNYWYPGQHVDIKKTEGQYSYKIMHYGL